MMAGQIPTGDAVEAAIVEDVFHVLIHAAIVPDGGSGFHFEETAIGDVAPAARADEIDRAAEIAVGMIIAAGFAVPERDGVVAFAEGIVSRITVRSELPSP